MGLLRRDGGHFSDGGHRHGRGGVGRANRRPRRTLAGGHRLETGGHPGDLRYRGGLRSPPEPGGDPAFAICRSRDFPAFKILPYSGAQLLGAFITGLIVLWAFGPMVGGPIGALAYEMMLRPAVPKNGISE